jgi:hypothetical protein
MPTITVFETVNAAPAATFAAFGDLPNAERMISSIKKLEILTDGPVGKGTRFRETRTMFGRDAIEVMEITEWHPHASPPSYTVHGDSCGMLFDSTFRFHPENGGRSTRVEFEMRTKAVSLFAKLMAPMSFVMSRAMKKCLLADLADMKRHLERAG